MAKEGLKGLGRNGQKEKKKNLTFHLLSLHGLRVFRVLDAGGPTGLCSVSEAFGVNETAVPFERCFSQSLRPGAHLSF